MTKRRLRVWVTATSLLALSAIVIVIAMHPWPQKKAVADRRVVALARREHLLRLHARQVERVLQRRWQVYESRLEVRQRQIAEARGRYEAQVAAARQAAARRAQVLAAIAQQRAAEKTRTTTPVSSSAVAANPTGSVSTSAPAVPASPAQVSPAASAPAAAAAPAPAPPPVAVVSLPPVTVSSTS